MNEHRKKRSDQWMKIHDQKMAGLSHEDRLEYLSKRMNRITRKHRRQKREAKGQNAHLRGLAIEMGTVDGVDYWIVPNPLGQERERMRKTDPALAKRMDHHLPCGLNGYVVFKEKPTSDPEYGGILTYVPVHGGITYAHTDELGTVFGFDTAHFNSPDLPIDNIEWIRKQCGILARGIKKASELEMRYLSESDIEKRAFIAQQVRDVAPKEELSFGVMINLLSGQI